MNCFAAFVKYFLYILNVIFVLIGILLIVLGSIMLSAIGGTESFDRILNPNVIPIMIVTLGSLIFVISFIGCCGTMRENSCLTTTYAVFMFILFALQLSLTVWIFIKRNQLLKTISSAVDTAWAENDANYGFPMDGLQLTFKCCGNNGYQDYLNIGVSVPGTCCGFSNRVQTCPAEIYTQRPGCNPKFVNFWSKNTKIIQWSGIAITVFEFSIFVIACCLASSMRKAKQ